MELGEIQPIRPKEYFNFTLYTNYFSVAQRFEKYSGSYFTNL